MAASAPANRNQLMHILSHQMPEFSSLLRAGVNISNTNKNYFYKHVSGKRFKIERPVEHLWELLSGYTEAKTRYNLFLRNNPRFPELFKTNDFEREFTSTTSQNEGYGLLRHHHTPNSYYRMIKNQYIQEALDKFREENPDATPADIERARLQITSKFNSENERQFFNEILVALTNPLPPDDTRRVDEATQGRYSAELPRREALYQRLMRGGVRRNTQRNSHRRRKTRHYRRRR